MKSTVNIKQHEARPWSKLRPGSSYVFQSHDFVEKARGDVPNSKKIPNASMNGVDGVGSHWRVPIPKHTINVTIIVFITPVFFHLSDVRNNRYILITGDNAHSEVIYCTPSSLIMSPHCNCSNLVQ